MLCQELNAPYFQLYRGWTNMAFVARLAIRGVVESRPRWGLGKQFTREGFLGRADRASGTVVFYEFGYEIPELRASIAKLGREFDEVRK
jgi:hypothetical protein